MARESPLLGLLGKSSVLLGIGATLGLFLGAGGAHAADAGPHYHPVAADIQNLAQDVDCPSPLIPLP
jgi:hypothetical protein